MISYAARLSLIMQMLFWGTDESPEDRWIDERAVIAGTKLSDYYTNQSRFVLEDIHDDASDRKAKELKAWFEKRGGKADFRTLTQVGPRWARKKTSAEKGLKDLQDRGWGEFCTDKDDQKRWFELTPVATVARSVASL